MSLEAREEEQRPKWKITVKKTMKEENVEEKFKKGKFKFAVTIIR